MSEDLGYAAHALKQALKPRSTPTAPPPLPSATQVGGDHYRKYPIQPLEYIVANGLGYSAGNVVKYVTRYKDKGGSADIRKAIHYLTLILEFEYKETL